MTEVCQICHKQLSRYICPTCNVPYCSLACFRDPAHSSCSERFYHKTLVSEIQSSQDTSKQDRAKLMDMVKRLEDIEDPTAATSADRQEHQELAEKLQGLDLDALDANGLEQLLTPDQLDQFHSLVNNGDIAALLADEAHQQPWWRADPHQVYEDLATYLSSGPELPPWNVSNSGDKLVYNLIAIAMAYVYTYRTFVDLDAQTVIATLQGALPLLADATSTVSLRSATEAAYYVLGRTDTLSDCKASASFMEDLIKLLRPQPVAPLAEGAQGTTQEQTKAPNPKTALASHHNAKLLGGLCHLHTCMESDKSKAAILMRRKLQFYMGLAASPATAVALRPMSELCKELERLEHRLQDDADLEAEEPAQHQALQVQEQKPVNEGIANDQTSAVKANIQELS